MNILSIGCGSKIDLAGLMIALADNNIDSAHYYGVDAVDWSKTDYCFYPQEGLFEKAFIQEYLKGIQSVDQSVLMFAYSMEELNKEEHRDTYNKLPWDYVVDLLPGKLSSETVYIVTPINSQNKETLDGMLNTLVKRMGEYRYKIVSDDVFAEEDGSIIDIDSIGKRLFDKCGKENLDFMRDYKNRDNTLSCLPILMKYIVNYRIIKCQRGIADDHQRQS